MIAGSKGDRIQGSVSASSVDNKREKHLRYRTRVFAAEYVVLNCLASIFFNFCFDCFSLFIFVPFFKSVVVLKWILFWVIQLYIERNFMKILLIWSVQTYWHKPTHMPSFRMKMFSFIYLYQFNSLLFAVFEVKGVMPCHLQIIILA